MGLYEGDITRIIALLQREGRVTYWVLQQEFGLDETILEGIRRELIFKGIARDEGGLGLVWTGSAASVLPPSQAALLQPTFAAPPVDAWSAISLPPLILGPSTRSRPSSVPPAVVPPPQPVVEPRASTTMRSAIDEASHLTTAIPSAAPVDGVSAPLAETPRPPQETDGQNQTTEALPPATAQPDQVASVAEPTRTAPEAERRQLTVMFCDLADSTKLAQQLDPEDLREVIRAYQATAAAVIHQYEGHIAQYLGDGLLVYFGWPVAHEDDAARALHTGLGIVEAITTQLNPRLQQEHGVAVAVRLGIHTGPVVVGEMGAGGRHEHLATGDTVHIASRLEGLAAPNTVVISQVIARLVREAFVLVDLGAHALKGVTEPMQVFRVVGVRQVDHDAEDTSTGGFAALVGRDEEIGLLLRRWEQSQDGRGHVVLLSGEAGIGKSSLVEGLRDRVRQEGATRIAFRCSPYHTHSAFYPIIEQVQRALGWQPDDLADTRLAKLEHGLAGFSLPLEDAVPLLASLLSFPLPEGRYPALSASPQQQRQQTQDVLVAWLLEEAERQPVLAVWEDLHWADPSTLETLGLMVEQAPTATMLQVLTFRPEFEPS